MPHWTFATSFCSCVKLMNMQMSARDIDVRILHEIIDSQARASTSI